NGGGGVDALMRQAVSALLSAVHPYIPYPYNALQVVGAVNAALANCDANNINNLEAQVDKWNNLGADLDAHGRVATISLPSASVNEGNAVANTPVTLTLTLSGPVLDPLSVGWSTFDGTAKVANNDYTAAGGTATFPANTLTTTVTVNVVGDNNLEP